MRAPVSSIELRRPDVQVPTSGPVGPPFSHVNSFLMSARCTIFVQRGIERFIDNSMDQPERVSIWHGVGIHPVKRKDTGICRHFRDVSPGFRGPAAGISPRIQFRLKRLLNYSNWSDAVCRMLTTPELENAIGLTSGISTASRPRS